MNKPQTGSSTQASRSFDLHSSVGVGCFRSVAPLQDPVNTFPLYGDVMLGFTYVGG